MAGAAEGIGEAFTLALAKQGFSIIMADRNLPAMHALSEKIAVQNRVETHELHLDLADEDAAERCLEAARSRNCRLLIYVAAKSRISRFVMLEPKDLDEFVAVNTRTMLHMVHGFANLLISKGKPGGIILMSSLAGLIGPKYAATYAATKSFAVRLAEALHAELKPEGIDILACCAGTVATSTFMKSNPDLGRMRPGFMKAEEIAGCAFRNLGKSALCIPGLGNRVIYFILTRLIPRSLASRLVNKAMDRMYGGALAP